MDGIERTHRFHWKPETGTCEHFISNGDCLTCLRKQAQGKSDLVLLGGSNPAVRACALHRAAGLGVSERGGDDAAGT
jgi:hypothetical protein